MPYEVVIASVVFSNIKYMYIISTLIQIKTNLVISEIVVKVFIQNTIKKKTKIKLSKNVFCSLEFVRFVSRYYSIKPLNQCFPSDGLWACHRWFVEQ